MRSLGISFMLIITFIVSPAYALQVKMVKENETVTAKISVNELTRIFVSGDRIQSTRGVNGAYELIKDEKSGAIFIKASSFYLHKSFSLFLTTESGATYSLRLIPMIMPAENIELKSINSPRVTVSRWERDLPYIETMTHLMNDMFNQSKPEGYAVSELNQINPMRARSDLRMQLIATYRGEHLQGEVWRLVSNSKDTLYLHPREFYSSNVRAISVKNEKLNCGDETYLYRVVDHDRQF